MKKVSIILSAIFPVLVSLMIQIAGSFILTVWFSLFTAIQLAVQGITDPSAMFTGLTDLIATPFFNDVLMLVVYLASTVVFLVWYRKRKEKTVPASFDEVFCIRNLAIMLFVGLALQIASTMGLTVILPLFPETYNNYLGLLESLVGGNVIVTVITTAVMAPITEEIIFRELMAKKLCKLLPFYVVNIIQAAFFGIYHMNIVQAVYAFILGLFLGYVAYRLKSIWASIILHGIINASGLILDFILPAALFESTTGMIIFAILCGSIAVLLSFLFRVPKSGEFMERTVSVPVTVPVEIRAEETINIPVAAPMENRAEETNSVPAAAPTETRAEQTINIPVAAPVENCAEETNSVPAAAPTEIRAEEANSVPVAVPVEHRAEETSSVPVAAPVEPHAEQTNSAPVEIHAEEANNDADHEM